MNQQGRGEVTMTRACLGGVKKQSVEEGTIASLRHRYAADRVNHMRIDQPVPGCDCAQVCLDYHTR